MRIAFGRVWAVWCLLLFITTALVFYPVFLLLFHFGGKFHFERAQNLVRLWANVLFVGFIMRLQVHGRGRYPAKPCIVVCNHFSQIDIIVLLALLPPKYHIVSKKEVARMPIVGGILKRLHMYFDRSDPKSRSSIMKKMEAELARGFTIAVFPEGTRNRGPQLLRPFQKGAFELAHRAQVSIAPLTIIDTFHRGPAALGFAAYPGKIRCVLGHPINQTGPQQSLQQARDTIERNLEAAYGKGVF